MYRPPFTVSSKAINLIAKISGQIEKYAINLEQGDTLRLRKVNRVKTIHSSLAIEGNTLSEGEVQAILEGKNVVAPLKEIQEVRNAIKTYELYPKLNPFSIQDMLLAHGTMMAGLVDEAGMFRRGGVGVFDGDKPIHIAPPAGKVKELMEDLFDWLENSDDHLLIRSCVFHPFSSIYLLRTWSMLTNSPIMMLSTRVLILAIAAPLSTLCWRKS